MWQSPEVSKGKQTQTWQENSVQVGWHKDTLGLGRSQITDHCKVGSTLGECHWKNLCWRWEIQGCFAWHIWPSILTLEQIFSLRQKIKTFRSCSPKCLGGQSELQFRTQRPKFFLCQTWNIYTVCWSPEDFTCSLIFMGTCLFQDCPSFLIPWYAFLNPKFMRLLVLP